MHDALRYMVSEAKSEWHVRLLAQVPEDGAEEESSNDSE
jgi:hypothetical protein